jgi:hypothetical protein
MRPLNLGETLDASIKIVMARWKTLATVMLVIALPLELANILIISSTTDVYQSGSSIFSSTESTKTTYSDSGAYAAGQVAILALTFLSFFIGNVACYRAIADTYLQRETSARESLSFAAGRLGATLWLTIILVVGIFCGFLFLILPGIWLLIAWSVALPVMLVEGIGGFGAIGRSFKLVEGRWWATCGRFVVAYILIGVLASVFGLAFDEVVSGLGVSDTSTGALILDRFASFLVSLFTTPFIAAVTTLVYFDLRVRKEGFDLALLAQRMGGASAYDPAPERDAFGNPVAPGAGSTPPPAPSSYPPPSAAPAGAWAPPVAPPGAPAAPSTPPSQPPPPVPDE